MQSIMGLKYEQTEKFKSIFRFATVHYSYLSFYFQKKIVIITKFSNSKKKIRFNLSWF